MSLAAFRCVSCPRGSSILSQVSEFPSFFRMELFFFVTVCGDLGCFHPVLNTIKFLPFPSPQISLVPCDLITKALTEPITPSSLTPGGGDGRPSFVFQVVEGVPPNLPDSAASSPSALPRLGVSQGSLPGPWLSLQLPRDSSRLGAVFM